MDNWNEFKTAYKLAELQTLSATALALNVHRSTVMRHIDSLETRLKIKLFQRSDKGYLPTEAGLQLMHLGEVTDRQFRLLQARLQNAEQALQGNIRITCVSEMVPMIMPAISQFQQRYQAVQVDIVVDVRNFNLQYGEADIAIRAGTKPTTLDNVVIPLTRINIAMCAHQRYCQQYGTPTRQNLVQHRFIALRERIAHLPWNEWIYQNIPAQQIAITASNQQVLGYALNAGSGLGFAPLQTIEQDPLLHRVDSEQSWEVAIWALVHRDMINLPKVKKFIDTLRSQTQWLLHTY